MAVIHGKLADIQFIPSTAGSIYSNPVSTETFIAGFVLFNSGTTAETVKLYCVPDSTGSLGTAAAANQFLEISLSGKETFVFEAAGDGIPLSDTNDSIQAVTTTGNTVTVIISGLKEA
jgi:hypothetical protein